MKKNWIEGSHKFVRNKNYRGIDRVSVYIKEGRSWVKFTDIEESDMVKKKLNFYSDKDVVYFKKTYR